MLEGAASPSIISWGGGHWRSLKDYYETVNLFFGADSHWRQRLHGRCQSKYAHGDNFTGIECLFLCSVQTPGLDRGACIRMSVSVEL